MLYLGKLLGVLKDHLIGIVALFSLLSAASRGAGGSITGTLAALSAFRFVDA
jgi:hypothetical protein